MRSTVFRQTCWELILGVGIPLDSAVILKAVFFVFGRTDESAFRLRGIMTVTKCARVKQDRLLCNPRLSLHSKSQVKKTPTPSDIAPDHRCVVHDGGRIIEMRLSCLANARLASVVKNHALRQGTDTSLCWHAQQCRCLFL